MNRINLNLLGLMAALVLTVGPSFAFASTDCCDPAGDCCNLPCCHQAK